MADVAIFTDDKEAQKWLVKLQKKINDTLEGATQFAGVLASSVFADIVDHFEQETGSDGPWEAWSNAYFQHMDRIGKGGNMLLQDSGRLKQGIMPTNYRKVSEGLLWFNPSKTKSGFPYAYAHDEGGKILPKRDFMWLSEEAMEKIREKTLKFILDEG